MNYAQRYAMKKEIRAYGERLRLQQIENHEREKNKIQPPPNEPAPADESIRAKEKDANSPEGQAL